MTADDDAAQDALADLGVAVREAAEARRVYERAGLAVGAAGARMEAAAANEERALEALRALHGAPHVVHTPEEPPSNAEEITTYSRGRRPSPPPDACTPVVELVHSGWQWRCARHRRSAAYYGSRDSAQQGADEHQAESIGR